MGLLSDYKSTLYPLISHKLNLDLLIYLYDRREEENTLSSLSYDLRKGYSHLYLTINKLKETGMIDTIKVKRIRQVVLTNKGVSFVETIKRLIETLGGGE